MSALAYLTARIDFPEDEVEQQEHFDTAAVLRQARESLRKLIATADAGMLYRLGVRTAIVGRPNAGKSSLLNQLLGEERAIVTPVPGTTRDTIEETVNIQGVPFVLVDTAGIRESRDEVESLGIQRSRRALEQADLVLLVMDSSEPLTEIDMRMLAEVGERTTVLVANKNDLPLKADLSVVPHTPLFISALTGQGIGDLQQRMADLVLGGRVISSDDAVVTNPRHKAALERAEGHLEGAIQSLAKQLPDDFVTIDLHAALNALGEITGETVTEELLDQIFSRFCIGK
jgi:tRNA modification GTPase